MRVAAAVACLTVSALRARVATPVPASHRASVLMVQSEQPLADVSETAELHADLWAARCEVRQLQAALDRANEHIAQLQKAGGADGLASSGGADGVTPTAAKSDQFEVSMPLFDALDDNSDGVLTREEFTKGYSRFMAETASESFDAIDDNGDGVLTREEFKQGFALLTSNTARAVAERERVEAAVAAERVRATQEAAMILAQAELRDALDADAKAPKARRQVPRRRPRQSAGPPLRKSKPPSTQ